MPGLSHVGSTHVLHFTVACIGFVMADFIVFAPTENVIWDSPFALLGRLVSTASLGECACSKVSWLSDKAGLVKHSRMVGNPELAKASLLLFLLFLGHWSRHLVYAVILSAFLYCLKRRICRLSPPAQLAAFLRLATFLYLSVVFCAASCYVLG